MTNCPNCGAPIVSYQCEYCGTVLNVCRKVENEKTILKLENELVALKTRQLYEQDILKELYEDTIRAMRSYPHVY